MDTEGTVATVCVGVSQWHLRFWKESGGQGGEGGLLFLSPDCVPGTGLDPFHAWLQSVSTATILLPRGAGREAKVQAGAGH